MSVLVFAVIAAVLIAIALAAAAPAQGNVMNLSAALKMAPADGGIPPEQFADKSVFSRLLAQR